MDSSQEKAFLYQLYTRTQGDMEAQASMYEIGETLGLDRAEASPLAETLFIQGLAELKTLSGGMGITRAGLAALDITPPSPPGRADPVLGKETLVTPGDQEAVQALCARFRQVLPNLGLDAAGLEALVLDLKVLDLHLISPAPKTAVVREVFRSMLHTLEAGDTTDSRPLVPALHHFIST